jgi:hypothetical protein|tara:strand:- start:5456 stop:5722 length:267 start_codon:yes stop_codon:yes gene_type:complete
LELLVALAVSAIALSLLWQASNNRIHMLTRLEGNYALSRLTADIDILRAANQSLEVNPSHYLPLELMITSEEIHVTSHLYKTKKIFKR